MTDQTSASSSSSSGGLPRPKPWITWFLTAGFLLALAVGIWGDKAMDFFRHHWAQFLVTRTMQYMEEKDWQSAYNSAFQANRWLPDSPEVLRMTLTLLQKTNGDAVVMQQKIFRLEELQKTTPEDYILLSQLLIAQQDAAGARKALAHVPASKRQTFNVMEVSANILREEGRFQEAEALLREALQLEPDNHSRQFRLAILDYQPAFPEMRQRSRRKLWDLASLQDETGMNAILFLADDRDLNPKEVTQLLALVEAHPSRTDAARYAVLSAFIRLQPQDRETIVQREIQAQSTQKSSSRQALLQWLLKEQRHQEVLQLVTDTLAAQSSEMMEFKLTAMSQLGHWEQIRNLLAKSSTTPLSPAQSSLWLAKASSHLGADMDQTRQLLNRTVDYAYNEGRKVLVQRTAELAEELGQWDLAATYYNRLTANTQKRELTLLLEKLYEIHKQSRQTSELLETAERLVKLWPDNPEYRDRLLYLKLLTGNGIEVSTGNLHAATAAELDVGGARSSHASPLPRALFESLAAYRMGDITTLRLWIKQVPSPERLDAGPRAVYAGLLFASGKVGDAYRLAEQIPPALLLESEERFLRRCL